MWPALDHFFDQQTHHRGQTHGLFSPFDNAATPGLDPLMHQREVAGLL